MWSDDTYEMRREVRREMIDSILHQAKLLDGELREGENVTESMIRRMKAEFLRDEAERLDIEFM